MLIEKREYRLKPGALHEFLHLYESEGLKLQSEALGNLIGYFRPESGDVNRVIHMWGFTNLEDRDSRRAALSAKPEWRAFLGKAGHLVIAQDVEFLKGTGFSPIR